MKAIALLLIFICSSIELLAQVYPVSPVQITGDNDKRIVYVVLGDGYQDFELEKYENDVQNIANDLFQKSPFLEYRDFFNIYRIDVTSLESGADHPGTATDVAEPVHDILIANTTFDCSFDIANIHRLLVPKNSGFVFNVLAVNTPDYDQGFVLSNSEFYGGSGGALATSSTHNSASEVSIHEIGHSFGSLADEYWNGSPRELANMTRESDPSLVKWAHWIGIDEVGVYPYGLMVPEAEWYRPHQNCEMRFLNREFCPVCKEKLIKSIYAFVEPIDKVLPVEGQLIHIGNDMTFNGLLVYPSPNTLSVAWILNDELLYTDSTNVLIKKEDIQMDFNILKLVVTDNTDMVRDPVTNLEFSRTWTILKDLDGDGFTSEDDCDDENPEINPDGIEIVNNGIDEDCDGEDATTLLLELPNSSIFIYPNPTTGLLYIDNSGPIDLSVALIDMTGKIVQQSDIQENSAAHFELELDSNFENGIYLLSIFDKISRVSHSEMIQVHLR